MWAEKMDSSGNVAGHVTDHLNGAYHGHVIIPWSGNTRIIVKLASAEEHSVIRFNALEHYGTSVYYMEEPCGIHYRFSTGFVVEFTRCVPHNFVYGYNSVCNFTNLNCGNSWFCGKPTKYALNCSSYDIVTQRSYNFSEIDLTQSADQLIKRPGHCVFKLTSYIVMNDTKLGRDIPKLAKCTERPKRASWTEKIPSGYSINGTW